MLVLYHDWLLCYYFRPSGTEDVVRVYAEADTQVSIKYNVYVILNKDYIILYYNTCLFHETISLSLCYVTLLILIVSIGILLLLGVWDLAFCDLSNRCCDRALYDPSNRLLGMWDLALYGPPSRLLGVWDRVLCDPCNRLLGLWDCACLIVHCVIRLTGCWECGILPCVIRQTGCWKCRILPCMVRPTGCWECGIVHVGLCLLYRALYDPYTRLLGV